MKMKRKLLSLIMALSIMVTMGTSVLAKGRIIDFDSKEVVNYNSLDFVVYEEFFDVDSETLDFMIDYVNEVEPGNKLSDVLCNERMKKGNDLNLSSEDFLNYFLIDMEDEHLNDFINEYLESDGIVYVDYKDGFLSVGFINPNNIYDSQQKVN